MLEKEQWEPGVQGLDTVRTLAFLLFIILAPLCMLASFSPTTQAFSLGPEL